MPTHQKTQYNKSCLMIPVFLLLLASGAVVAQERTVEQWIEVLAQEEKNLLVADPQLDSLLIGAAWYLDPHTHKQWINKHKRKRINALFHPYMESFEKFEQTTGREFKKNILDGNTLSKEGEKYYYIISTMILKEYRDRRLERKASAFEKGKGQLDDDELKLHRFVKPILDQASGILKKGYAREQVSADEMRILRLYRSWLAMTVMPVVSFLPGQVFDHYQHGGNPSSAYVGKVIPDLRMAKLHSVLNRPSYSDEPPEKVSDHLRVRGLLEFVNPMKGFEVQENEQGKRGCFKKPLPPKSADEDGFVRLSDAVGKKPALYYFSDPNDSYSIQGLFLLEAMYRYYKEDIDFYIVANTIGDTRMSMPAYFGRYKGGKFPASHAFTEEERARQCKLYYMQIPFRTIPYLLDDISRTAEDTLSRITDKEQHGGYACALLVDVDGKLVYPGWVGCYPELPLISRSKEEGKGLSQWISIRSSLVERAVHALVANHGKYHEGFWKYFEDRKNNALNPSVSITITEVDLENQLILGVDRTGTVYKVQANVRTRLLPKGHAYPLSDMTAATMNKQLARYKSGEAIYFMYEKKEGSVFLATLLGKGKPPYENGYPPFLNMYVNGEVTAIDNEKRLMTVVMPKPNPMEWHGYQFWKEAGEDVKAWDGDPARGSGGAKTWLPITKRLLEGTEEDRTFHLAFDDAVHILRNGYRAKFEDLKVGDYLGIGYPIKQDGKAPLFPMTIRAHRKKGF